jgi:hypothetical protein
MPNHRASFQPRQNLTPAQNRAPIPLGRAALLCGAVVASTGCLQVLGLDAYKEGNGGAGTGASGTTGTMSTGTGTMTTGTMSTSASSGTGGGTPVNCAVTSLVLDVMSGADLNGDVSVAPEPMGHRVFVASGFSTMTGNGVRAALVRDGGSVSTASDWVFMNGGVQVMGTGIKPGAAVAYVRAGGQLGEVRFPIDQNGFSGTPTFVPFNDIPDPACNMNGFINEAVMQEPLDVNAPRWAVVCHNQSPMNEKLYIGNATTSVLVATEAAGEPADKLRNYFALPGGQQAIFTGGDPSSGTWARFGPDAASLAVKHQVVADTDPNRLTLGITETPDGSTGLRLFVATIDKANITPAHFFTADFPAASLGTIGNMPTPGLTEIAQANMLSELAGFDPVAVTTGHLGGAGATIDNKNVLFTWLKSDGTLLARLNVRVADPGMQIDRATTTSLSPAYLVVWKEGNTTTKVLHAETVLCTGGT